MGSKKHNTRHVLETQQIGWMQLHAKVLADDTTISSTMRRDFDNKDYGTPNAVPIPYGVNGVIITFFGIAKDQTSAFTWRLYGYRGLHGPGVKIASGTGNLGNVQVNTHPVTGVAITAYYADYLTIASQPWPKTVAVHDVGESSGEIANLTFDAMGISHLRLELQDCDAGSADETDELEAVFTGY